MTVEQLVDALGAYLANGGDPDAAVVFMHFDDTADRVLRLEAGLYHANTESVAEENSDWAGRSGWERAVLLWP